MLGKGRCGDAGCVWKVKNPGNRTEKKTTKGKKKDPHHQKLVLESKRNSLEGKGNPSRMMGGGRQLGGSYLRSQGK